MEKTKNKQINCVGLVGSVTEALQHHIRWKDLKFQSAFKAGPAYNWDTSTYGGEGGNV